MQLGECTAVPQNTHPPACPSRYLVLAFKIFLAPIRAQHMASRLQPDKPRGYRFHARTAHHSHRRRHPLLQPRQHQLLQHHPLALPCPNKITVARSAGQTTLRAHIASPARPSLPDTTVARSGVHKVSNCTKSNEKRNRRRRANSFFLFQFSDPMGHQLGSAGVLHAKLDAVVRRFGSMTASPKDLGGSE